MASLEKMKSGWRVHLFRRGHRTSKVFPTKAEAVKWAKTEGERFNELADQLPKRKSPPAMHLEEGDIIARAVRHEPRSGVYFLIDAGKVVYVGQSVDVFSRIACHVGVKKFDAYHVIDCPRADLRELEAVYIKRLNPVLNIAGRLRAPEAEAENGVVY